MINGLVEVAAAACWAGMAAIVLGLMALGLLETRAWHPWPPSTRHHCARPRLAFVAVEQDEPARPRRFGGHHRARGLVRHARRVGPEGINPPAGPPVDALCGQRLRGHEVHDVEQDYDVDQRERAPMRACRTCAHRAEQIIYRYAMVCDGQPATDGPNATQGRS